MSARSYALHNVRPKIPFSFLLYYREIINAMVKSDTRKIYLGARPVFDGKKYLYTRNPLPFSDKVGALSSYFQRVCTGHSMSLKIGDFLEGR